MRVLIVDDEELIRNVIKEYLLNEGYIVDEAVDGLDAIDRCLNNKYDLIVMDIMMPNLDGYSAIKKVKEIGNIPIIILSARCDEIDKLNGFDIGIDDYLTKPFSTKELVARIKAIFRRYHHEDIIKIDSLELNKETRIVTIDNKEIELTHTQFELLALFLDNLNIVLSREKIIYNIFGYDYEANDRTIDAHIKLLRSKIGRYRDNLKTIRKVGYKFEYLQ